MVELTRTAARVARARPTPSRRRAGGRRACAAGTARWSPTSSAAASSPTRPVAPRGSTRATSPRRQPDAAPRSRPPPSCSRRSGTAAPTTGPGGGRALPRRSRRACWRCAPDGRRRAAPLVAGAIGAGLLGRRSSSRARPTTIPPLDPRSDEPDGTSALVALLEELGTDVELSVGLPDADDDVALVLADRLDEEQTADVLAWTRAGGTLVVTDPASSLTPPRCSRRRRSSDETVDRGICTIDALDGVEEVDGGLASALRHRPGARRRASAAATSRSSSRRTEGAGDVVADRRARLRHQRAPRRGRQRRAGRRAARARGPGTTVRFVDAPLPAGGGDKTLGDLVSDGVRRAGLQLGIAFLLYAAWRAVRLGRPVPRDPAGRDRRLRAGRRRRSPARARPVAGRRRPRCSAPACGASLRPALGVPPSAPPAHAAQVVAERTGADPEVVAAAVGDQPVTTDDELVAVARAVASVHQEVLR